MTVKAIQMLLSAACLLLPILSNAQTPMPHIGRWISREVSINRLSPSCAYVNVMESSYDLAGGFNGTTSGIFTRQWQRYIWSNDIRCRLPGDVGKQTLLMRFESWGVIGKYISQTRQYITASYIGCRGDCEQDFKVVNRFQMNLSYGNNELLGEVVSGITNTIKYQKAFSVEEDQAAASSAYWALFKPLLEGNCNQFVNESLDSDTRPRVNQLFCDYGHGLAKVLPKIFSTEPSYAFAVSLGSAQGVNGPVTMRSGDVLIARLLVFGEQDGAGGVITGAVMRKQAGGAWKIVDLVFL